MGSGELAAPCGCPSEPPQQQTSIISRINAQLQRGAAQPCRNSVSTRGCRWQHRQHRAKKVAPAPARLGVSVWLSKEKSRLVFFGAIVILPPSTQSFWNRKASAHRCASPKGPGAGGTFALCHPQQGRSQRWTGAGWCPGPPRSSPIPNLARTDAGQCH